MQLAADYVRLAELTNRKFGKGRRRTVPVVPAVDPAQLRSPPKAPTRPIIPTKSIARAATESSTKLGKRKRHVAGWMPEDGSEPSAAPSPALRRAKPRKGKTATHPDAAFRVQESDASAEPSPVLRAPSKRKAQDHPEATFRPAKRGRTAKDEDEDSEPVTPVKKGGKKPKATKTTKAKSADAGEAKKAGQGAKRKIAVVEIASPANPSVASGMPKPSTAVASGSKSRAGTRSGRPYIVPDPQSPVNSLKVTKKAAVKGGKGTSVSTPKAAKAAKADKK